MRLVFLPVISCVMVLTAGCGPGLKNLPTSLPRRHVIRDVPFYAQGRLECVVACMEMVTGYYTGREPDRDTLKRRLVFDAQKGTTRRMMLKVLREDGFDVPQGLLYRGKIGDIIRNVARDHPVIVRMWATERERKKGWAAHYRVVTGYDLDKEELILLDPARGNGKARALTFAKFNRLWDMLAHPVPSYHWMAVPVPGQG